MWWIAGVRDQLAALEIDGKGVLADKWHKISACGSLSTSALHSVPAEDSWRNPECFIGRLYSISGPVL